MPIKLTIFCACIVSLFSQLNFAQAQQTSLPHADTSSPRATLKTFIDSCNELDLLIKTDKFFNRNSITHRPLARRILDCLDTHELPEFTRADLASEAAVCLKEIIDRIDLPAYEDIPDLLQIDAAGGPEQLSRWNIPGTRIVIARIEEGPHKHEYLFSAGTVDRSFELYEEYLQLAYRNSGPDVSPGLHNWYTTVPGHPLVAKIIVYLPNWMNVRWLGLTIWQWIGLVVMLLIAAALMVCCYRLEYYLSQKWREDAIWLYCLTILLPILAALIPLAYSLALDHYLTIRGGPLYVLNFLSSLTTLLASLVFVFEATTRIAELIISTPRMNAIGLNAQLIRIISKLIGFGLAIIIFLEGGRYLGFPLTTLVASAGVGGLAIALAAQDTLKMLFGTIMLLSDKPFRVGERIVMGSFDGVVEDIGLRSTRIRLLNGHQVYLPNDELAHADIENVGRRPFIRRVTSLEIPATTSVEKVQQALDIVRSALDHHEGMHEEYPPHVYLKDWKESAIEIIIFYWYHPADYWKYMAFSEKLNLQIMQDLEAAHIPFAQPAVKVNLNENNLNENADRSV